MGKKSKRSTAFRSAPSSAPIPFRDTCDGQIGEGESSAIFNTTTLLPSLVGRVVVLDHFVVEVMPGVDPTSQEDFNAQVQYASADVASGALPRWISDAPYKMLSVVNPTQMHFNVRRMKEFIPSIAYPVESDDTNPRLQLQLDAFATTAIIKLRVTTYCRVIPQLTI